MSPKRVPTAFGAVLLVLFACLFPGSLLSQDKMTPDQKTWLEDVSPIITKMEREVFLKLRTNAERDKFIVFFWRMRDPTPDTTENEFKKEYMGRVRFADQTFGHESPKRGSQTERGYFYLLLGPPLERHFYTTNSEIYPLELWFYKGAQEYGLPDYFYLIFYQPEGLGDYRLFSPGIEGPEKLVIPQMSVDTSQRSTAYQIIKEKVNSELASATISYLPGDRPGGLGSFSSDNILASIKQLPEKKYSDAYARSYLSYKDFIETEYADHFLSSAFQAKVLKAGGQPFLHWAIEPEKMNFGTQASSIYASFELVLRLENSRGLPIFERTEEIPLKLTAEQYKAHERQRFAFQDLLAVIPGEYRALFLLKNKTAKDFTSFEFKISIPGAGQSRLSSPLLFHSREAVPEAQRANLMAFTLGGFQYLIGARNEFLPAETLGVCFQAWNVAGLKLPGPPSFVLEIFSVETGKSLGSYPLPEAIAAGDDPSTVTVMGNFSLSGVKPGYYRAEVSALAPSGQKVLSDKENFIVLAQPYPFLPWVYARMHGPFPGAEHLRVLGTQYFLAQDYGRARGALEGALRAKDDPASRLLLAKSLFGLGRFQESLDQALPLYERAPDREAGKVIALDYAALKDWTSALNYLEKLMAEATEVSVLNLAAEGYLNLGRPEKALPLLQKSLSLVPDQPPIKDLEEKTRRRLGQK
ncbi:MAG: GWxTD domain-containing protein [Candidatus Aminicenantales bacterium]